MRSLYPIVAKGWSAALLLLGLPGSIASAISLLKSIFAVDLVGLPAAVLADYVAFRNGLFAFVPLKVPGGVYDMLLGYLLVGSAFLGALRATNKTPPARQLALLLGWPRYFRGIGLMLRRLARDALGPTSRAPDGTVRTWRDERLNHATGVHEPRYRSYLEALLASNHRIHFLALVQCLVYLVAAVSFFTWNHLLKAG